MSFDQATNYSLITQIEYSNRSEWPNVKLQIQNDSECSCKDG